jgi:outer membrane protein assembly factor BamB
VWGDQVYVTFCAGKMKDQFHVLALKVDSGEKSWEQRVANSTPEENTGYVSRAAPTPVADADGVVAFFEGGNLIAWGHDGSERWKRDLVKDYGTISARHGLASSLEQDAESVYVWVERSEDPYVLCVSKKTGGTRWKSAGVGKTSWASARLVPVGESHHLVLSAIGRIFGLKPTSGEHLWTFEDIGNNSTPTPMPLGDGRFLIGATAGRGGQSTGPARSCGVIQVAKRDDETYGAEFLWRAEKAKSSFGSPIGAGDHVYFVNRAGVVFCLDAATGEQRYAERVSGSVWATPLWAKDRIYLFGKSGTTTVIRSGPDFEIVANNTLWPEDKDKDATAAESSRGGFGGPRLYAVAVAGPRLLLRRGDRVYCVGASKED